MNQQDDRVTFAEAVAAFQEFLRSQKWNSSLRWLTRERITGYKGQFWIYRPEELSSSAASEQYFEETQHGAWNLALMALTPFDGHTLAYVERGHGESRMLNFSINTTSSWNFRIVRSQVFWRLVRGYCRLRGLAPFLKHTAMTPGD